MPRLRISSPLPYRREQLFDLAADVERYPEFLPGWYFAEIVGRDGDVYVTDQIVGFGPVRERFRTRTKLKRPEAITVSAIDGPFEVFEINWSFSRPADGLVRTGLEGVVEPRTWLMKRIFGRVLAGQFEAVLAAFEARAGKIYGAPQSPPANCGR